MTVVDGPASCGGMEYPMMTCIGGDWTTRTLYDVEAHEIAHMWFPMQVGSDEKRYAWMDEGMAQYYQSIAIEARFPSSDDAGENRRNYVGAIRYGKETEMMRHGDRYPDYEQYGTASYFKPATVLVALGAMLSDSLVLQGIREYGQRWSGKHPMPQDFFNTMNAATGQDLDWFWRTWYYETWKLDQAIEQVTRSGDSAVVVVENKGKAPMPVILVAKGTSGSTTTMVVPVDVWLQGEKKVTVKMAVPADLSRVEIDPSEHYPDADRSNQVWSAK
jgi:aminopeptidase N